MPGMGMPDLVSWGKTMFVHRIGSPFAETSVDWNEEPTRDELLKSIPVAIYTTDADGWLTYYNDAAAELWGYRPVLGEARWCGCWRIYTADGAFLPLDQCPMAIALKEGRPVRGIQAVLERPDGTRMPFMPYPTPLRDEAGKLVGASNMLLEITRPRPVMQPTHAL